MLNEVQHLLILPLLRDDQRRAAEVGIVDSTTTELLSQRSMMTNSTLARRPTRNGEREIE